MNTAVREQLEPAIRGWVFVDGKIIAAALELSACRRRPNDAYALVFGVVFLVDVTERCDTHSFERVQAFEKLVTVPQADSVEPLAAHRYRRVVQANHHVFRWTAADDLREALEFIDGYAAAGIFLCTAIDADNQPVADFFPGAI